MSDEARNPDYYEIDVIVTSIDKLAEGPFEIIRLRTSPISGHRRRFTEIHMIERFCQTIPTIGIRLQDGSWISPNRVLGTSAPIPIYRK